MPLKTLTLAPLRFLLFVGGWQERLACRNGGCAYIGGESKSLLVESAFTRIADVAPALFF